MEELVRTPAQLGAALRRVRRVQRQTQKGLGEATGLRQATVSEVENARASVKLSTVLELLRALDLELVIRERTQGSNQDIEGLF